MTMRQIETAIEMETPTRAGFEAMNQAIKTRAEAMRKP